MAGIGAEGYSVAHLVTDEGTQDGELLEGASQSRTATGGRFQQHDDRTGHFEKAVSVGGCIPGQTGVTIIHVVAWVRHQEWNGVGLTPPKLGNERRLGANT